MNQFETLEAILSMAKDDNKGLKMTTTVLNSCTINEESRVTFQVDKDVTSSAGFQSVGIAGDYLCCAFFISRKELRNYKKQ